MSTTEAKTKAELLRESLSGTGSNVQGCKGVQVDDAANWPCVMEVLAPAIAGGQVKGGRIGIYINNDRLQVCLSWPEAGAVAFLSLDGLTGLLEEVERLLDGSQVKWMRDKASKSVGKR